MLDKEQRRFLKGISHLEPSWLIIAKRVCTGRSKNMWWARQNRVQLAKRRKWGGGSYLRENLAGIYLVFVSVFLLKWADVLARSFWLLSEIWTSVLLCRKLRILTWLVGTV